MQKTPVSLLQELMVKKGSVPNYELIHDGGGTHENTFTYRVLCEGLAATGTGRCKKDAKHVAAKNMLDEIAKFNALPALPASPAESPVRTPTPRPMPQPRIHPPNEPFINAIGELKDLCADHELPEPAYITVSDIGPPHARVFTIHCALSSFIEEGVGTTKKHAKHIAAGKMYERVKELISHSKSSFEIAGMLQDHSNPQTDSSTDIDCPHGSEVANMYNKLTNYPKTDLGVRVADYHTKLKSSYDLSVREEVLNNLMQFQSDLLSWDVHDFISFDQECLQKLNDILAVLNVSARRLIIAPEGNGETENKLIMPVYLNTSPEIVEVGLHSDKIELVKVAHLRVINTLKELLL